MHNMEKKKKKDLRKYFDIALTKFKFTLSLPCQTSNDFQFTITCST